MRSTSAPLTVVAITFAVVLGGCGESSEAVTPTACLDGVSGYQQALGGAPTNVELPGGVKISECLVRNQSDGDLVNVGDSLRIVATDLSRGMKEGPAEDPPQAIRAGYLVGALRKAAEGTDGIHATLVQRVEAAATNNLSKAEQAEYKRGLEAGGYDAESHLAR